MSTKSGSVSNPKLLKGSSPSSSTLDIGDITAAIQSGGGLSNIELDNPVIFGGSLDGTIIGSIQPVDGAFQNLNVGKIGNPGGLIVFGTGVDSNNNPIHYVSWGGTTNILNIAGGLHVTDGSQLGNIVIVDNNITAINPGGNINLIPNNSSASINIAGNLTQTIPSNISFPLANNFSVLASNILSLVSVNDNLYGSENGTVNVASDVNRYPVNILTAKYFLNGSTITVDSSSTILQVGQNVFITGTGLIDSTFTIQSIGTDTNGNKVFTLNIPNSFITLHNLGVLNPVRTGRVNISAGSQVNFKDSVPLTFGSSGSYQPFISSSSSEDLNIFARYLKFTDPIPTLSAIGVSDFGYAVDYTSNNINYTGYFGFVNSTQNFTWIPNATITLTNTGKTVTGQSGNMQLNGIIVSEIDGNPNILLNAPNGNISLVTQSVIIPDNVPIQIGNNTIESIGNNLNLESINLNLSASSKIQIPTGTTLSFNNVQGQTITGTNSGLIISSILTSFNGLVNANNGIQFGNAQNLIVENGNNLTIGSGGSITISPQTKLFLPENVFFQIGNTEPTGLYGALGSIFLRTVADFSISSGQYINLTSLGGKMFFNSSQIILPVSSEILFGNQFSISTLSHTITNGDTLSIGSPGYTIINCNNLNLNASIGINVPINTVISFGNSGNSIYSDATTLFINSIVNLNAAVTINGSLTVNGPTTYIHSTVTVIDDPVIYLGGFTPPVGDIRDRGVVFEWYAGTSESLGFIGLHQSNQTFYLCLNGTLSNDIYTPVTFGNLQIDGLIANSVNTQTFTVSQIFGNPSLQLIASDISLTASNKIYVPVNIPFVSGNVTYGATDNNTFSVNAGQVSFTGGHLKIGETLLSMVDVNDFVISNVPNIYLNSSVTIGTALNFANTGVSIIVDNSGNIEFTSQGGKTIFTGLAELNGGMSIGNASFAWSNSVAGGELILSNNQVNTSLNLSVKGNILDANWEGNSISASYGGTGHTGLWYAMDIVFVGDTGTFLTEDQGNFVYNHQNGIMGIGTSNNVISIGAGNVDLMNGSILYRRNSFYSFSAGQRDQFYMICGTSNSSLSDYTQLNPYLIVNKYGQIGLGMSETFMNGLSNLPSEYMLYVSGSVKVGNGLYFSNTEYINGAGGSLDFYSAGTITYNANVLFNAGASFLEVDSKVIGQPGGILQIQSNTKTEFTAPHVLIDHRLCLHHDALTGACELWLTRENSNILSINNAVNDILLNPLNNVIIPNNINVLLGSNSVISSSHLNLNLICNGIGTNLNLQSNFVNILQGSILSFFAQGATVISSTFQQLTTNFQISSSLPFIVNVPSVTVPAGSPLIFDSVSGSSIVYTNNSLNITSPLNVSISSQNFNLLNSALVNFYGNTGVITTFTQAASVFQVTSPNGMNFTTPFVNLQAGILKFGATSNIYYNSGILNVTSDQKIALNAPEIDLNQGNLIFKNGGASPLPPANGVTQLLQTSSDFQVNGTVVSFNVNSINIPDNSPIYFGGGTQRSIVSGPDSLTIYSPDLLKLVSDNVHITGNLIVDKLTTFTIESETSFDSGVIIVGGGQYFKILALNTYFTSFTLITVDSVTNLVPGDTVLLFNCIPDLDGTYTIVQTPSLTTFSIALVFPGIPTGAVAPYGEIRSSLTHDPGSDLGTQFNWNLGVTPGTGDSRIGFFGFRRSTQCFTVIPQASKIGNDYFGALGDICCNKLNAVNLNAANLVSNLNCNGYTVSGSSFTITGGSIDGTPIGAVSPNVGFFTNITVGNISINSTGIIANLNAQYLNGIPSSGFVTVDGLTPLIANWNAGNYQITAGNYIDNSLTPTQIVFTGPNRNLISDSSFTFSNGAVSIQNLTVLGTSSFSGTVNLNGSILQNANITNSNITVPAGKTLDVSLGNVIFSTNQIQLNWLNTGTANISISGNSSTVTNGVYTTNYLANSFLKADSVGVPIPLIVPEGTFIARLTGGVINAIPFSSLAPLLSGVAPIDISGQSASVVNGIYKTDFIDNSIIKCDVAGNPYVIIVPEQTLLGRLSGGLIEPISFNALADILNVIPNILYTPNSILFENSLGVIGPLTVPYSTIIGRDASGEISALTRQEARDLLGVVDTIPLTEQNIDLAGGLLKSGNLDFPDGGLMSGLLFTSCERVTIITGQTIALNINAENSYVSVNYSVIGGRVATCTLQNGIRDGHRKVIQLSSMDEYAVLQVNLALQAPQTVNAVGFIFIAAGQSVMVMWDGVLGKWCFVNNGVSVLTEDDLQNPNLVQELLGEIEN